MKYTQINSKPGVSQRGARSLALAKPAPSPLNLKSLAMQAGTKCVAARCRLTPGFEFICVYRLAFLILLTGCAQQEAPQPKQVPVKTAFVLQQELPLYYDYIGHVIPLVTVNIVPQVQGYLTRINFKEGQEVQAGDLLATIDERPYKATLAKAEATLAQTMTALNYSEETVQRYAKLLPENFVSEINFDNYVTDLLSNEAIVKQNLADIEIAKLNVGYCSMRAPVSGIIGVRLIDQGNFIPPNSTNPIAVLNQLQPITVEFYAPEDDLMQIRKDKQEKPLQTRVFLEGKEKEGHDGILTLINNQVDQPTGSILLRAEFPNEDKALWPGQFVSARLFLKAIPDALLVPSLAVVMSQQGPYLFIVESDGKVSMRSVVLGTSIDGMRHIKEGVKVGEEVVLEGQLNLIPGTKVIRA